MGKKWRDLYDSMPPERRARIEAGVARQVADMPLAELRRARALTQQQIAQNLEVNQAWVSKVERQTDMYVSTLRSYIEAMGGDLDIIARFGDGVVRVRQFGELLSEEAGLSYSEPPLDVSTRQHAVPQVKVWSPQPSPSAITDAQPKARVWEGGESSTPGQKTPGRSITTKVA